MVKDMTRGNPIKQILSFCVPLLIGNLFQQFYNLVDSIIVGNFVGIDAFAAVGSTASLNFLILGFALGICSGFSIPIAQSFGAGDYKLMRKYIAQSIYLSAFFAALITVITFFYTRSILTLVHTPADIIDQAFDYIFIIFMGVGATVLFNMVSGIMRSVGNSKTPLFFLIIACVINIGLDLLFIAVFDMGVKGAAYATVIAQLVSGLLCILYIKSHIDILHLSKDDLVPDFKAMGTLFGAGVPMGLQFSITAIGSITLQSAVNSLGTTAVASVSAGVKVHSIVMAPMESLGLTMATYCGQNLGAKQIDRIKLGIRKIMYVILTYCVFGFCVDFFLGVPLSRLFLSNPATEILNNVHLFLTFQGLAYPLLAVVFIYRNSLQGLGYSNSAMLAGLCEMVARIMIAYRFVPDYGFVAVCFSNPTAWLFADILLVTLFVICMKKLTRDNAVSADICTTV